MSINQHEFPVDLSDRGYCVFPQQLEDDEFVLFHATPMKNFRSISKNGFKPDPQGTSGLKSVSFAWNSSVALAHAMGKRDNIPGEWCIFAVRYDSINRAGLTRDGAVLHDYKLAPSPKIIGYCIVPETYKFQ